MTTVSPLRAASPHSDRPTSAKSQRLGAARFFSLRAIASTLAGLPLIAIYAVTLLVLATAIWMVVGVAHAKDLILGKTQKHTTQKHTTQMKASLRATLDEAMENWLDAQDSHDGRPPGIACRDLSSMMAAAAAAVYEASHAASIEGAKDPDLVAH